jgi:hypothetical protein
MADEEDDRNANERQKNRPGRIEVMQRILINT